MDNFVKIASGLAVAPALAELARQPEYWPRLNPDASRYADRITVLFDTKG